MANKQYEFISVDYQVEFADPRGKFFCLGNSVSFINTILIPFLKENHIKINEIVSDYRQPRPTKSGNYCDPNDIGYMSLIPEEIKKSVWVKAMHNPIWIRNNGGIKNASPGYPYPDPEGFTNWILGSIGKPSEDLEVILFGETMEVCVTSLAQELYHRGYRVNILYEATDPMNERLDLKDLMTKRSAITLYADIIRFDELLNLKIVK